MSGDEDYAKKQLQAWADSTWMDSVADYAGRGRRFVSLSDSDLSSAWVQTVKDWLRDIGNGELRSKYTDYSAEIDLRGIKLPIDMVIDDMKLFAANAINWRASRSAADQMARAYCCSAFSTFRPSTIRHKAKSSRNSGSCERLAEGEVKMRHAPKLWTREEEEELRALILSGKSPEAIAKKFNRTPKAIRNKAHNLRLPLKRVLISP